MLVVWGPHFEKHFRGTEKVTETVSESSQRVARDRQQDEQAKQAESEGRQQVGLCANRAAFRVSSVTLGSYLNDLSLISTWGLQVPIVLARLLAVCSESFSFY